ncbi:MAG: chorismate-binding protein [Magnetococcales bacterium]|nr:chorismate-binding protein [Magnetococcales bacterium]
MSPTSPKRLKLTWEGLGDGSPQLLLDFAPLKHPLWLGSPVEILIARKPSEVSAVLAGAEAAAKRGFWVGGGIRYEAAAAFDLPVSPGDEAFPLVWFGVFSRVCEAVYPADVPLSVLSAHHPPTPEISRSRYLGDLEKILDYIQAGDSYQVNYTLEASLEKLDPAALFLKLQPRHRHPFAAYLDTGEMRAASFSPELFLLREGEHLTSAPIKGTRPRGGTPEQDRFLSQELLASQKERAEHLMIVDMVRNDLGRVCEVGSVRAPHLFEPRIYPTVRHLETRVQGRIGAGIGLEKIFSALFPAASITGAPKHRTMEIIRELEQRPRGLYTGSIGVIKPGGDFIFNVAIRTVTQTVGSGQTSGRSGGKTEGRGGRERQGQGICRIGLGGGVVADSRIDREWLEIGEKGCFLEKIPEPFQLIETMGMNERGEIPWLREHLNRLEYSARSLGFAWERDPLEREVLAQVQEWLEAGSILDALRLLLAPDGTFSLSQRSVSQDNQPLKVRIDPTRVDRMDPLLGHKTSRRELFNRGLREAQEAGYDEALFLNNLGQVTEGAIQGILVLLDSLWRAPPLTDGLLPSLWRKKQMKQLNAIEQSLTLGDLARAEKIVMGNAVRGSREVRLLDDVLGARIYGD